MFGRRGVVGPGQHVVDRWLGGGQWHDNLHLLTSSVFRFELEGSGAATETLDAEVMIGVFAMEGLLTHPLDEDQQRAICDVLAERWSTATPR